MSDSRLDFEHAVRDKWSDSYSFERAAFGGYADEVLEGMWWAWQARAQDSGEPVAWMGRHPGRITGFFESEHDAELSFGFEGCTITALYTRPLRKHGDGFVKCSEQMPENNENVQVFPILEHSDNEPVHVAFRCSGQWEYIWCGSVYHLPERKITHWRALSYPSVQEQES